MAAVDRDKLRQHAAFVRDTRRRLEEIRDRGRGAFVRDHILQAAAVRYLQVGIEALLDIANHIIAREGLGVPRSYRDSVDLICQKGILPEERRESFRQMVGFRNRAVHLYDELDPERVFGILERHLFDFDALLGALADRYFSSGAD